MSQCSLNTTVMLIRASENLHDTINATSSVQAGHTSRDLVHLQSALSVVPRYFWGNGRDRVLC